MPPSDLLPPPLVLPLDGATAASCSSSSVSELLSLLSLLLSVLLSSLVAGAVGAIHSFVAGYFNTTSAIDEIDFKFSSGNIDSGTIDMYGVL